MFQCFEFESESVIIIVNGNGYWVAGTITKPRSDTGSSTFLPLTGKI